MSFRTVHIWRPRFKGDTIGEWTTELEGPSRHLLTSIPMGGAIVDIESDYCVADPLAVSPRKHQNEMGATLAERMREFVLASAPKSAPRAPKSPASPTQTALGGGRNSW